MANKRNTRKTVESIRHKDKRANIPTEELRDFVSDEELAPRTMLYPRDPPSIRNWSGRARTSRTAKTSLFPWCLSTSRRRFTRKPLSTRCLAPSRPAMTRFNLFADFNGLEDDFEKKVDFYSQKDDRQKPWSTG